MLPPWRHCFDIVYLGSDILRKPSHISSRTRSRDFSMMYLMTRNSASKNPMWLCFGSVFRQTRGRLQLSIATPLLDRANLETVQLCWVLQEQTFELLLNPICLVRSFGRSAFDFEEGLVAYLLHLYILAAVDCSI
ncbi:hypothetical protein KC342_g90 [Hortaea werneckii]|nr:hypothetical protein KC342_g90 [Hortaea werneckii]